MFKATFKNISKYKTFFKKLKTCSDKNTMAMVRKNLFAKKYLT